jgi:hypothetical protein
MADKDSTIFKDLLHELYEYRDGELYCKSPRRNLKVGDKVGSPDGKGYIFTRIDGTSFFIHRLIFMMHHGYLPEIVDHIDGNKLNNRIENLRASDHITNQWNAGISKRNTSGVKGVGWVKSRNRWEARILVNKKKFHIGYFKTIEEAKQAIEKFREEKHGEFSNHGCNRSYVRAFRVE